MGIVQSLLAGMRQARQDQNDTDDRNWMDEQRAWQAQRQNVQADQQDATFNHNQGRWAGDDAYTDQTHAFNIVNLQHAQDRQPIVDQQTDTTFDDNVAANKQLRSIRAAADRRATTTFNEAQSDRAMMQPTQELRTKLGLTELQHQQLVQNAQSTYQTAVQQFMGDHDPKHIEDWFNTNVSPGHPAHITQASDGSYDIHTADGQDIKAKDAAALLRLGNSMTSSDAYLQALDHAQTLADATIAAARAEAGKAQRQALNSGGGDPVSAMKAADDAYFIQMGQHLPGYVAPGSVPSPSSAGSAQAAVGAAGAPQAAPTAVVQAAPARITSQADFDALPKGARFVNPADGSIRVKN